MQHDHKQELTDRFLELAEYLNHRWHIRSIDQWEGLDMTIPQIKTLALLELNGQLRMGNIANYLGRALSATTTLVDRLVEKGLVDRVSDPSDRRVVVCELTDLGRDVAPRFWRIGRERIDVVVEHLEDGELETVVEGLELVYEAERRCQESLNPMQPKEAKRHLAAD